MRQAGNWGDHLTLTCMAHLLNRPIKVITDSSHAAYVNEVTPPDVVARETWGEPISIAHYGENHYEATIPLQPVKQEF